MRARAKATLSSLMPTALVQGGTLEDTLLWPWQGVKFTPAYVALLTYVFVITSYVVPLAQASMIFAVLMLTIGAGGDRWRAPQPMLLLLAFFAFAAVGYKMTRFSVYSWEPLQDLAKVIIVAWVAISVLTDRPRVRFFIFFYLGVFALFPARGAVFNKFIYGADTLGRVSWNNIFSNPNDLAALVLFPLGLAAALYFTERQKWVRLCAVAGIAILPLVIFMTQSRAGILAMGAMVILFVIVQGKGRGKSIMALAGAGLVVTLFSPASVWSRLSGLTSAAESGDAQKAADDGSAAQRVEIMKVAVEVVKEFPVTGVGWGAYPNANSYIARKSKFSATAQGDRDAHNTYLTVAAETGVVGLMLWLGTIFWCVQIAIKGMREVRPYVPEYALQLKFVLLTLFAYGIAGIFGSFAQMNSTYLHMMTILALGNLARQEAAARSGRPFVA